MSLSLMRLLQLSSPSLPIGGFTYSQGLEWATEAGWVTTVEAFREWQLLQLEHSLVRVDLPILQRLYQACAHHDIDTCRVWGQWLLSSRETMETRQEEQQRSQALFRVLQGLSIAPEQDTWRAALQLTQASGFAWAGCIWEIPLRDLLAGYGYSWLENSVMAGLKLVPYGQQAAQALLIEMSQILDEQLSLAMALEDDELGGSVPLVAIASSRHETQHTRLFRS
ncbi:Urease accessory protein UreF [Halomonadaceae bacterium LMG 33818]|uniref:urease accessory protein UreF n=1 Tax=Cernens ardua TaxID=3402176 RepID=UPI003EDBECBF